MDHLPNFLTHLPHHYIYLLRHYAYASVGLVIFLESIGIPLPAESLIVATSLYSGATHSLNIWIITLCVTIGAILGDNLGYFIGHKIGYARLVKLGNRFSRKPQRLMLGLYLFRRFGPIVVLVGRFFALLRIFVALLAGAVQMNWRNFGIANIIGGILWSLTYCLGAYEFGEKILILPNWILIGGALLLGVVSLAGFLFLRKNETQLMEKAVQEMGQPGGKDEAQALAEIRGRTG